MLVCTLSPSVYPWLWASSAFCSPLHVYSSFFGCSRSTVVWLPLERLELKTSLIACPIPPHDGPYHTIGILMSNLSLEQLRILPNYHFQASASPTPSQRSKRGRGLIIPLIGNMDRLPLAPLAEVIVRANQALEALRSLDWALATSVAGHLQAGEQESVPTVHSGMQGRRLTQHP